MPETVYMGAALLLWALFAISFVMDRSRYRNCYFLFFALASTVVALVQATGKYRATVTVILFNIGFLLLLLAPVFLIINGVLMIRREGHGLSNLLSLIFGILIAIGELATYIAIVIAETAGPGPNMANDLYQISRFSLFLSVSVIYVSVSFVIFMLYTIFLQIIPRKRDFDYVIIHGAGLLGGSRVSKLLSDRLDKAIEVYQKDPTPPVMIPSGGKGPDETISEAEAMEGYLLKKGIPANKIIREDRSTTTYENLENSKEIILAREGSKYTVLVTSNYHVYRALRYCRKIGLVCTGVGSHVALYFWPSALIREFIAIHAEKKHLMISVAGWIICMLALFQVIF